MKNLKTEWITDISIEAIQNKVNEFTQTDKVVVRATQTHTLLMNNNIVYTAVVFYEN